MGKRDLADAATPQKYFEPTPVSPPEEGTRDLGALAPFVISGGVNTERYYFLHINDLTERKFNIVPRYFGGESNYTAEFSNRISKILEDNFDAKVFCVFDWDAISGDATKIEKHRAFLQKFQTDIEQGRVSICPSMPSIEYWFLLHFVDETKRFKSYSEVSNVLAPYMKDCFPEPLRSKTLKKLLKKEQYLQNPDWVQHLCADGKLETAIQRAEGNIQKAIEQNELDNQSYSYVYLLFK